MSAAGGARRVVVAAGVHASPWHLQSWGEVGPPYEVSVLLSPRNVFGAADVPIGVIPAQTIGERLPTRALGGLVRRTLGDRYVGLAGLLRGADVVHSYELGSWFAAQVASLRAALGFRLALTTWETIPWRAQRSARARRYRAAVLEATDLYLPTTERARDALLVEGVPAERIVVNPPGIDVERFAGARTWRPSPNGAPLIVSVGRLVPEKGHEDVMRALARLRAGAHPTVRLMIVGQGPEEPRLRALARELGVEDAVELAGGVGYEGMPDVYARATCLVLASRGTATWEEQFGMVLAEAMAAHVPVVASASGAIPEVVGESGALFAPGDWRGLADALATAALAGGPGARRAPAPERLERFSTTAAAARLRAAYDSLAPGAGTVP